MKIKGLRWWIIGLIALATIINYIDRSALSVMWWADGDCIAKDLGYESKDEAKEDYALILNIFLIAYAVGQMVSGRVFDKVGTRIGFTLSILIWSVATMIHSLARSVAAFSVFRVLLGIGEAGNWPGAVKSNAEWFPIKERAVAQGIFNAGASFGSVIAPPLIAVLFIAFGWKMTFVVIGVVGLLWIIPWLVVNKKTPAGHNWITDEERKYILSGQHKEEATSGADEQKPLSVGKMLSFKPSWAIIMGRFFLEPVWWFFVGWLPIFLAQTYNFDIKEIGAFAWIPYVGAAVGSVAGGMFAGKLMGKGRSINVARKSAIVIGGVLMFLGLLAVVTSIVKEPLEFVFIIALVLFGFQFAIGNIQTLPSDLFTGKSVGTLAGIGGMVGVFSVITMNFLIPSITKQNYNPAFIIIAVFVPLGVLSIFLLQGK